MMAQSPQISAGMLLSCPIEHEANSPDSGTKMNANPNMRIRMDRQDGLVSVKRDTVFVPRYPQILP